MHLFYKAVSDEEITQQLVSQLIPQDNLSIFMIPWGHIVSLLNKFQNDKNKLYFYSRKTVEGNWSRAVLMNVIDSDLYSREGKAITNFHLTLPKKQGDLAQALTRDPYNFIFLTLDKDYDEKQLKDALMDAEYNGSKAIVEIEEARVIKGMLPSKQLKLILAWCVMHHDELMQNWELAKDGRELNPIKPLM